MPRFGEPGAPPRGPGLSKGGHKAATLINREFWHAFVSFNAGRMQELLDRVADDDPGLALKIILEADERVTPKLRRVEHAGDQQQPVVFELRDKRSSP